MTASLPSSARHYQLALAVVVTTLLAYAVIVANANVPLPRIDGFIPAVMAITFVSDVVVAVLLYAQFRATGSRALLVLASGYCFASLIVLPHALTFPGAFAPMGMLGAGPQTSAYLSVAWRLGLSIALLLYAFLVPHNSTKDTPESLRRASITWALAIIAIGVGGLTWVAVAGNNILPSLMVNGRVSIWGHTANGLTALTSALALVVLWARGRSILDLWLMVAACGLIAEGAAVAFFVTARFTFGFYGVRIVSLAVSKVVLIVLLWETMRLYTTLWISNRELQRERANRLTSAEAVVASIAHEIKQPLTNISLLAFAGQGLLNRASPDVSAAKKHFGEIEEDAFRVNEVFDGFLRFFRGGKPERQAVDVNALALEATRLVRRDLDDHQVTTNAQLASDLPLIQGHAGQLREVILNLLQNSIEAMAPMMNRTRVITIATSRRGADAICISMQDTGPGIEHQEPTSIFDPFVTTKAKGTGLGLAICKMIVEQHGGELSAVSDENGGARFEITLPTAAAAAPTGPDPREKAAVLSQFPEVHGDGR